MIILRSMNISLVFIVFIPLTSYFQTNNNPNNIHCIFDTLHLDQNCVSLTTSIIAINRHLYIHKTNPEELVTEPTR